MTTTDGDQKLLREISGGFRVLPVQIPHGAAISGRVDAATSHLILFKRHQAARQQQSDGDHQNQQLPNDRTLFITQLPACASVQSLKAHLQHVYRHCGRIERISLAAMQQHARVYQAQLDDPRADDLIAPGTFCYAVFEEAGAVAKALQMPAGKRRYWTSGGADRHQAPSAIQRWKRRYDHARPDREELRQRVESTIADFDRQEEEKQNALKAAQNRPDEDGWITVTRVDRRNRNTDGKTVVAAAKPQELERLKPKEHLAPDFYRFQMRQDKRQKLLELRQKFEEDKQRLAQLKANRRFKPY